MNLDLGLRLPGGSGAIERAGHGDFGRGELIEALQRSVQLMARCRIGFGRRSFWMSVVGARTSCRQSCIDTDGFSDRFVTDSGPSGDARPGSRDRSRHRLGPPGFDPSQREQPAYGCRLLSEGLGRCPRRASSGFHPKRQTPSRVKGEREDDVAFSDPEKPPDACTPAARREGRLPRSAAQQPGDESDEHRLRTHQQSNRERVGERSPLPAQAVECRIRCRVDHASLARGQQGGRQRCEPCHSIATARPCRSPPSATLRLQHVAP